MELEIQVLMRDTLIGIKDSIISAQRTLAIAEKKKQKKEKRKEIVTAGLVSVVLGIIMGLVI